MLRSRIVPAVLATAVGVGLAAGALANDSHHHGDEIFAALSGRASIGQVVAKDPTVHKVTVYTNGKAVRVAAAGEDEGERGEHDED